MNFFGSYCIGLVVGAFVSWLFSRTYYTRRNTHIQVGGDNSEQIQIQTVKIVHNMSESDEEKYIKKLNEESIPTGICLFNDDEDDGTYYE